MLPNVPHECRWVLGDQTLVRAMRQSSVLRRGRNGRLLHRLLRSARFPFLQYFVLAGIGFIEVSRLWICHRFRATKHTQEVKGLGYRPSLCVFVTCAVRAERHLYEEYCKTAVQQVVCVSQNDVRTTAAVVTVGYLALLLNLLASINSVKQLQENLPAEWEPYRLDWLTFGAMRLGLYTFYRTFWEAVGQRFNVVEANFLAADTAAFAAVDVGLPTTYQQHGLLSASVLVPAFTRVHALSRAEANHIRAMHPAAEISHRAPQSALVAEAGGLRRAVLLVSEMLVHTDIALVRDVIRFFSDRGYCVYIRPAPGLTGVNSDGYWRKILNEGLVDATSSGIDRSFSEVLEEVRPAFVVAWTSTTLVDALYSGLIPITLAESGGIYIDAVSDTVFPLFESCLRWASDRQEIERIASGLVDHADALQTLLGHEIK